MENYFFNITDKNRTKKWCIGILALTLSFLNQSCNSIFEKDISDEKVNVIIPTDNDTLFSNQVHFKWEEIKGADFYNLQIVKPSFADIDQFVLDSNIAGDESYQILAPGNYEFKIRGENGAHVSEFTKPVAIYVDSVSDLSEQFVSLISPADAIFTNGLDAISIAWQNLFAAEHFEYYLKVGESFETGSTIDQNLNIASLSYLISSENFSVENVYHWGVRGVNTTSSSAFSSRSIYVDLTSPNSPTLLLPADEEIVDVDEEVTLKWTTGIDPGTIHSPVSTTVEIATTELFTDFITFSGITSDSLNHTFTTAGDYWWRAKTEDQVGNISEFYSVERKIIVE